MAFVGPAKTVILVVDDEPMLRFVAMEELEDAGFEMLEACDAEDALAQIGLHPEISVVFTDINMPGPFDGLELARRVRQQRPDIRLIITSGRPVPAARDIPDHGQFIAKPYDTDVVARMARAV
ncbi:MAG TPA: response regulator [Caulobacteraceae bacterium]|jgi:CheY-like chemotaxis protein|nr:response regulator [Caulobacteraceae bacterium]